MAPPRKRNEVRTVTTTTTTTTFTIGNCKVELPSNVDQEHYADTVCLKVSEPASISITAENWKNQISDARSPYKPGGVLPSGLSFQLLNPKSLDGEGKHLLESAVQLYHQELPAMSFAANTGKESNFLKSCTTNGKYCTLLMTQCGASPNDNQIVVGAITYQILPPDTQFAEIPLAAVDQVWQRKGLGGFLFRELARRLADVGVLTLFCWGDQESESFWSKQGFLKIAEVDSRGKPQKLPLKAEIRKAMSLPGSAALMVCNIRSSLPQLNSTITSISTCDKSPGNRSDTTTATTTGNGDPRAPSDSTYVGSRVSPMAGSKATDTVSPISITPCRVTSNPFHSLDQAVLPPSSGKSVMATRKGAVSEPESTTPVMYDTTPDPKPPIAKLSRTLSFAGVDELRTIETERIGLGPVVEAVTAKHEVPSAVAAGVKSASPEQLVVTLAVVNSEPAVVVRPTTETHSKATAHVTICGSAGTHTDVASREPFRNVRNTCGNSIVAPVKRKPWKRTQTKPQFCTLPMMESDDTRAATSTPPRTHCDDSKVAANTPPNEQCENIKAADITTPMSGAVYGGKHPVQSDPASEKENNEPVIEILVEQQEDSAGIVRNVRKRSRAEITQVKAPGRKSAKVRRGSDRVTSKEILKKFKVPVFEPVTPSKPISGSQISHAVVGAIDSTINGVSECRGADTVECEASLDDYCLTRAEVSASERGCENSKLGEQEIDPPIEKSVANKQTPVPKEVTETLQTHAVLHQDRMKTKSFVIFLMSTSKNKKNASLVQMVERLGGKVAGDGAQCTHVVTTEVRRTLNFCTAICKGAWVVSPDWLKTSNRKKCFVDEKPYLLKDRKFETKYKVTVASVVEKVRQNPCSLFAGYYVYPTPHLNPPHDTVIKLTKAAGGKIVSSLKQALQQDDPSHSIVLGCEDDIEEGIIAAEAGLRTFNGEWFMQSVVTQNLDMSANLIE